MRVGVVTFHLSTVCFVPIAHLSTRAMGGKQKVGPLARQGNKKNETGCTTLSE